jgi:hypothetical protein
MVSGPIPGIFGGPLPVGAAYSPAGVPEPSAVPPGAPGSSTAVEPAAAVEEPTGSPGGVGANGMMAAGGLAGRPGGGASGLRSSGRSGLWAGNRRRRKDTGRSDPWAVAQGGPAVLEPDEPTDHDPGPGVIGLDR